jgi:hypothetical protein
VPEGYKKGLEKELFTVSRVGLEVVRKSISECYEIFTLKALFARGPVATFAPVMNVTLRTNSTSPKISAHNVLRPSAGIRPLKSDVRQPNEMRQTLVN